MKRKRTTRKPPQLDLVYPTRGGARTGAGRKPKYPRPTAHRARPALASRFPVHVTLKIDETLPDLRGDDIWRDIEDCLRQGKEREGFRLIHYSMMTHHLHLIVEAVNTVALTNGIRAISVRIARRLNRLLGRRGRVFSDRYFSRILKTPRETRSAISYVLLNVRRHAFQHGRRLLPSWIDDCSSGRFFDGWKERPPSPPVEDLPSVAQPCTWLLRAGWKKWGLISISAVPGGTRAVKYRAQSSRR